MIIRHAQNIQLDCDSVFTLSNDPLVRACSFNTNPIEYEHHCNWFAKMVVDPNTLFFLIFEGNSFVGQIRFHRESEQSQECLLSLSITKEFRGKHIAGDFLQLGIDELKKNWHNIKNVIAEVKESNNVSQHFFRRLGYSEKKLKDYYMYNKMIIQENIYMCGGV